MNVWHHFVLFHNSTNKDVYVDNVKVISVAGSGGPTRDNAANLYTSSPYGWVVVRKPSVASPDSDLFPTAMLQCPVP